MQTFWRFRDEIGKYLSTCLIALLGVGSLSAGLLHAQPGSNKQQKQSGSQGAGDDRVRAFRGRHRKNGQEVTAKCQGVWRPKAFRVGTKSLLGYGRWKHYAKLRLEPKRASKPSVHKMGWEKKGKHHYYYGKELMTAGQERFAGSCETLVCFTA